MTSAKVSFGEPKFMTPAHASFKCDMCESWIAVKVTRNTEIKTPGAVKVQARVAVASETLKALQEEERLEKERRQSDSESLPSEMSQ